MNKQIKKTLVPKLRFIQFKKSTKWDIVTLGSISKPIYDKAGASKHILMSVTSGVGLVSQIEKFGREIAGNSYKNYIVIKKNDFAYNKSATKQFPEGYISMLDKYASAAVPNSIFTCFRISDKKNCPKFFDHLFHLNHHGAWLKKFISIGARAHGSLNIDTKYLWNMPIAVPGVKEQQKIADCLTSVDEIISAENTKLSALKKHKKALLQNLFPAEDQSTPAHRFPEFKNSGSWDMVMLCDLANITGGGTPDTNIKEYWDGDIVWFTPTEIGRQKYISISRRTITKAGLQNSSAKLLPKGTILLTTRATLGEMSILDTPATTNQGFQSLSPKKGISSEFLYYLVHNIKYHLNKIAKGSTFLEANKSSISKIMLAIPKTPKEQQKIADCLSSIDNLITAQANKLEALKKHKKALLQNLFPTTQEF